MRLTVYGIDAYVYTGTKPWQPQQPWVLFIHGAANDHSVWALQSRYFAYHGWNVVAVDLPGHGLSAGKPLASVDAIAQWCESLIDVVGAKTAAIVGHSMGSLAALALAAKLGDRASHLALLGSAAPMAVSDTLLDAARDAPDRAYKMIVQWSFAPAAHLGGNKAPGMWMTGQSLALMRRARPDALHQDLLNCKAFDARGIDCAAEVSAKTLVLSAAKDMMTPAKAVAPLVGALKVNSRITLTTTTLSACGHSMMSEKPDEVLASLKQLLAA